MMPDRGTDVATGRTHEPAALADRRFAAPPGQWTEVIVLRFCAQACSLSPRAVGRSLPKLIVVMRAPETPLVRFNIGLEDTDDLIADLEQALSTIPA